MARPVLLLVLLWPPLLYSKGDYNYGLLENEPLLRVLCEEDRRLYQDLLSLNRTRDNRELARYLDVAYRGFSEEVRPEVHVQHPVNSYSLIKRAAVHSRSLGQLLRDSGHEVLAQEVERLLAATRLYKTVGPKDMTGAMNGLIMIAHAYKLDVEELRRGSLRSPEGEFEAPHSLDVSDLYLLAEMAEDEGFINTAARLLASVSKMVENGEEVLSDFQRMSLKKKIKAILLTHNGLLKKRQSFLSDKDIVNTFMLDEKLGMSKKQPKFVKTGESRQIQWGRTMDYGGLFAGMERMLEGCRDFPSTPEDLVPLYRRVRRCHHLHHRDPFNRLGPFKVEVASALPDPHIVVIHGMLEEEDLQHWHDWASPRLSRERKPGMDGAKVSNAEREAGTVRTVYKSVQAWKDTIVFEGEKKVNANQGYAGMGAYTPDNFTVLDPRAERLSRRLERALALNVTNQWSSHTYQVTNYGLAGTCEAHIDPYGAVEGKIVPENSPRVGLKTTGDYIGTTMAWLEDTPVGGATTFFNRGMMATIRPTRGSVAFWFSLLQDSRRDMASMHGGCPVAVGAKWILNKWIYSYNNWARQPCGRRPSPPQGTDAGHTELPQHRLSWPLESFY